MLLIPTYVSNSSIHGLGVFAGRRIKKGERVWTFHPHWECVIPDDEFTELPSCSKRFLKIYAYHNRMHGAGYILESDNGRFMNHSEEPNLDFSQLDGFALRAIAKGEELTCNYRQCCDEYARRVPSFRHKANGGAPAHMPMTP